jgi:hypothetical protein
MSTKLNLNHQTYTLILIKLLYKMIKTSENQKRQVLNLVTIEEPDLFIILFYEYIWSY